MSDHVTWEVCPRCGLPAAVGWASVCARGEQAEVRPIEFDCRTGCQVSLEEVAGAYGAGSA